MKPNRFSEAFRTKKRIHLSCLAIFAASVLPATRANPADPVPAAVAPVDQDARMAWFREAKFGLFIHWGLYAIPAGEWKGKTVPGIGEWIMNRARIPDRWLEGDWETPATLNHTWGYRKDDPWWKSPGEVTFKLMDIVSKGGNYLLNIGPDAEGNIPAASVAVLRTVGDWLKVNGEAVYGTTRSPFGQEFGDDAASLRGPNGKPVLAKMRGTPPQMEVAPPG